MTPTPNHRPTISRRRVLALGAAGAGAALAAGRPGLARAAGQQAIGAIPAGRPVPGPAPAYSAGPTDLKLVQNWDFGTNGNIPDIATMNTLFQYHDQFGTYNNGDGNYGADTVAPDAATAVPGQPIEDPSNPVRAFTANSLQTYLVPLNGATTVTPDDHNVGCGSFVAQYTLPAGGALLGLNLLWETRVRYVTPPYYWFAIWASGNIWDNGAEMDVIESFGYNNGGGNTNYNGRYWHSDTVGGLDAISYGDWATAMAAAGITSYDAAQYHIWQWYYNADDTYRVLVDGIVVQSGNIHWTVSGIDGGEPINMYFLFDGAWGSTVVASVNYPLPASELEGKLYEWDYSRIYLGAPTTTYYSVVNRNSGLVLSVDSSSNQKGANVIQWSNDPVPSQQWSLQDAGNGYHYLVNRNSGLVLSVDGSSTAEGATIVQCDKVAAPAEQWKLQDAGNGYSYLVNRNSGLVLSVDGSSTSDGGQVIQGDNTAAPAEQWQLIPGLSPALPPPAPIGQLTSATPIGILPDGVWHMAYHLDNSVCCCQRGSTRGSRDHVGCAQQPGGRHE